MKEALEQLGIEPINEGTSTGVNNFPTEKFIESYSPADGAINSKSKNFYQSRLRKSNAKSLRSFHRMAINASATEEEKSCVKLEMNYENSKNH